MMNKLPINKQSVMSSREVTLDNPWLTLGRAFWLIVMTAALISYTTLALRGTRMLLVEPMVGDSYQALTRVITYINYARLILVSRYFVAACFFATGLFIFWRKSHTVMGLVASLTIILLPLLAGLGGQPPVYPQNLGSDYWRFMPLLDGFLYLVGFNCMLLFVALFPNGRLPGRWLTAVGIAVFAVLPIGMGLAAIAPDWDDSLVWPLFLVIFLAALVIVFSSAVYRYFRVSNNMEKQQTRWVMASVTLMWLWGVLVANTEPFDSFDSRAPWFALFQLFGTVVVVMLVPLSIARAIMRYHLWDIDVIVRRTLIYTLLTGFLVLVYLGSVIALQGVFSRLTGQDSTLATILSTLLIAALFLPVRRQIQRTIDRRFYRRKYDAQKTLEQFAHTARDETDLEQLTAELMHVIQETMQPAHVSIWLRPVTNDEPPSQIM